MCDTPQYRKEKEERNQKKVLVAEQRDTGKRHQNLQGFRGVGKGLKFYPKNYHNYLRCLKQRRGQIGLPSSKDLLVPFCGKRIRADRPKICSGIYAQV